MTLLSRIIINKLFRVNTNMCTARNTVRFGHIYWRNPKWKTSFLVQCCVRGVMSWLQSSLYVVALNSWDLPKFASNRQVSRWLLFSAILELLNLDSGGTYLRLVYLTYCFYENHWSFRNHLHLRKFWANYVSRLLINVFKIELCFQWYLLRATSQLFKRCICVSFLLHDKELSESRCFYLCKFLPLDKLCIR